MKTILDRLEETIVYIEASSNGRTTNFDFVGIGSIPFASTIAARRNLGEIPYVPRGCGEE